MSGGRFDYKQYVIEEIRDEIERALARAGKPIPEEDEWLSGSYPDFSDEVKEEFRKGVEYLRKAHIYAHRIDWLLSGDDGEDGFLKRLKEDLDKGS